MAVGCTVGAGVGFWAWGGGDLWAAALYTVPAACSASYRCGLRAAMYFKKTEDRDAWRGSRVYSQRFSTFSARRAVHPVRSSHFLLTFPGRKYDCISKPDPSIDRRRWAAIGRRLGSDVLVVSRVTRHAASSQWLGAQGTRLSSCESQPHTAPFSLFTLNVHTVRTQNSILSLPSPPHPPPTEHTSTQNPRV